jgi:hypothetical protein
MKWPDFPFGQKTRGSGGETRMRSERARFLSAGEKSERRIERVFLAGEKARGFEAIAPRLPLSPRRAFSSKSSAFVNDKKRK